MLILILYFWIFKFQIFVIFLKGKCRGYKKQKYYKGHDKNRNITKDIEIGNYYRLKELNKCFISFNRWEHEKNVRLQDNDKYDTNKISASEKHIFLIKKIK